MILKYLVPVKLSIGILPTKWLLEKYNLVEVRAFFFLVWRPSFLNVFNIRNIFIFANDDGLIVLILYHGIFIPNWIFFYGTTHGVELVLLVLRAICYCIYWSYGIGLIAGGIFDDYAGLNDIDCIIVLPCCLWNWYTWSILLQLLGTKNSIII